MATDDQELGVESIVRVAGIVHAPAIVCARDGQPTVIDNGLARLELVQDATGWRWLRDGEEQGVLEDVTHLTRILAEAAQGYARASAEQRTAAEQRVEKLCARWFEDTDDMPTPRPWGLCAPGRPLDGRRRRQLVFHDADQALSSGCIIVEAERLHPPAHVSFERGQPTLVDDGLAWLLFFDWWDGWRYSLDGGDRGRVEDHLHLQVLLAERAEAYAAASDGARLRAAAHVAELSRLPVAKRYQRAQEHAMARRARVGPPADDPADDPEQSLALDPTSELRS